MLQIDYQLNVDDMAAFQVYWWRRKSKIKPWVLVVLLMAFVSFSQARLLLTQPLLFLLFAGLPFLIILSFALWFVPFAAKLRAKTVPAFLEPRLLCIDPAGLWEKTVASETN